VNYLRIALTAVLAVGFTLLTITLGARVVKRVQRPVVGLKIDHSRLIFALILCFGFAALASLIGIAGIIGAFLAGVAFSESTDGTNLHHQSQGLTEFLTPFFLVTIGMKLELKVFLSSSIVLLAAAVIGLAMVTKLIGCGLGAIGMGRRRALQVGVGMIPRGEVGLIFAGIGASLMLPNEQGVPEPVIGPAVFGAVVIMVIVTTLVTPPALKWSLQRTTPAPEPGQDEVFKEVGEDAATRTER
jgi:Kef-type K+ transport system membrane component KefB